VASVWKHPESRYWTACFRDQNRRSSADCSITTRGSSFWNGQGADQCDNALSHYLCSHRAEGYKSPEGLRFAGRVGIGFSEKLLASIDAQLQKLKISACPFINLPEKTKGRRGLGITRAVMKRCEWVKPVLVAHEFIEITFFPHPGALHC
jgi:ATP-dependent DNA ligase